MCVLKYCLFGTYYYIILMDKKLKNTLEINFNINSWVLLLATQIFSSKINKETKQKVEEYL